MTSWNEIEVTKVDEAAAQRLADATGRVTYLSTNPIYRRDARGADYQRRMTTDRDEAVGWGESVAFVPQPPWSVEVMRVTKQFLERQLDRKRALDEPQTGDHFLPRGKAPGDVGFEPDPEPQLRVVRVLEMRGPKSWIEKALANSWVSETEPRHGKSQGGAWEVVEQIRTTEKLCRWCGGEHLGACSEDECSGNPRKGKY